MGSVHAAAALRPHPAPILPLCPHPPCRTQELCTWRLPFEDLNTFQIIAKVQSEGAAGLAVPPVGELPAGPLASYIQVGQGQGGLGAAAGAGLGVEERAGGCEPLCTFSWGGGRIACPCGARPTAAHSPAPPLAPPLARFSMWS